MPKIMPITVLRDTNEISDTCRKVNEPIFITKNGHGDMVVMSIETYERDLALVDVYRKLYTILNTYIDRSVTFGYRNNKQKPR